jgi:predicted ribosomally synthesized peptide with SipW-like signal peptide
VARHVRLLGILAGLWGALAVLVAVSMLLLAGGAFALWADVEQESVGLAAGLTVWVFLSIGLFCLLWGTAHLRAATLLPRHAPSGRTLALGLAVANLLVFPFGTALGGYALWVLLAHEGRRLFDVTVGPDVSAR